MNKTQEKFVSPKTGKVYTYDLKRMTGTDYREFMNGDTKYQYVFYQVNVYVDGKRVSFRFVDDPEDMNAIAKAVKDVIQWHDSAAWVLESMHSRFD